MRLSYCCCLLALISYAKLAQAQKPQAQEDHPATFSVPVPLQLPLAFYVGKTVVKPSRTDSIYQLVLSRQKVRTVTKLKIRPGAAPDTVEYTELDRRGNKTMLYTAGSRERVQMKYDDRNRLLERIQLPSRFHTYQILETFDLKQKRYAHFKQEAGEPRQPLMTAQEQIKGDTTIIITQISAPISPQMPVVQTICRSYRTQGDTARIEVAGYDEGHRPLGYEVYVVTKKAGLQTSAGRLLFTRDLEALLDSSSRARQWRSQGLTDTEILMRNRQHLRGQLVLSNSWTYAPNGQLLSQEQLNPEALRTKPVKRTTATSSITLGASIGSMVRYFYDKKGHLIREESTMQSAKSDTPTSQQNDTITITKSYSAKDLLLTETQTQLFTLQNDQLPTSSTSQYEYHYTYY